MSNRERAAFIGVLVAAGIGAGLSIGVAAASDYPDASKWLAGAGLALFVMLSAIAGGLWR